MKKKIRLKNEEIDYVARKSRRAKHLRLAIYCDGSLVMTMPQGFSMARAEAFMLERAEWILMKLKLMKGKGKNSIFSKRSKKEYLELKNNALELVQRKIEKFNTIYGLRYNRISIRNQKTRWGSCSQKGNLNFNYKIVLLPEKYAEYIIVHELCHLKEFNHSQKFWNLVTMLIPDHKEIRKKLRKI